MKLFFIFPLKGPINGVKVISQKILDALHQSVPQIEVIDTSQAKEYNQFGKFNLQKFFYIGKIFKQLKVITRYDLVYMNFTANGFAMYRDLLIVRYILRRKAKITIHIHESKLEKIKSPLVQRSLKKVNIILINQGQLEDLKAIYPQCVVVKNALPDYYDNHFEHITKDQGKLRLLYMSNISIPKGSALLQKLAEEIHRESLDVSLTICGGILDETSSGRIHEITEKYSFVDYKGPVNDLDQKMELYRNHDFLLFLSDENYEVYPLVYIESLMSGLPVITTKQTISEQIVSNDSGIHLQNENLELTLNEMLQGHSLTILSGNARSKYENEYNFEDFINKIKQTIYGA